MMTVENRLYDRVTLEEGKYIPCEGLGFTFEGQVTVIGLGGLLIRTTKSYPVGTVLPLRLRSGDDVFEADCIVRDLEEGGIGVEFVKLRGANEEALRRMIQNLR